MEQSYGVTKGTIKRLKAATIEGIELQTKKAKETDADIRRVLILHGTLQET